MSYTLRTIDYQKVPGHKTTEPSLDVVFQAKYLKDKREASLDGNSLSAEDREEYIDSIGEELKLRTKSFKFQIYEIGKLLCEAKKQLPHGKFRPWLDKYLEFSYKSAANFMKVFKVCMGHPELVEYFNPSCLYILCSPSFPEDLREAIFDGVKGPVDVNKKELVRLTLKYRNNEISIYDKEVQGLLIKERESSLWEKYKIELEALKVLIDSRLERIKKLSVINPINPLIQEKEDEEEYFKKIQKQGEIESMIENFKLDIDNKINEIDQI